MESSTIREIDFRNFEFSKTSVLADGSRSIRLENGTARLSDGRKLSIKGIAYADVADDFNEDEALVSLSIEDGNAILTLLYVFALDDSKPKILEHFAFGDDNTYFATAFGAHGELVIETFNQLKGDAECCPSEVEISYYKWKGGKFTIQGRSQKIANGYVERVKGRK